MHPVRGVENPLASPIKEVATPLAKLTSSKSTDEFACACVYPSSRRRTFHLVAVVLGAGKRRWSEAAAVVHQAHPEFFYLAEYIFSALLEFLMCTCTGKLTFACFGWN